MEDQTHHMPATNPQRASGSKLRPRRPRKRMRQSRKRQSIPAGSQNSRCKAHRQPKEGPAVVSPGSRQSRAEGCQGRVGRCRREALYLVVHGTDCRKQTRKATGAQALARLVSHNQAGPECLSSKIRPPAAPFDLSWHRWLALAHSTTPHRGTHAHEHMQTDSFPSTFVINPHNRRHTGCRQQTRQRCAVFVVHRSSSGRHAFEALRGLPTTPKQKTPPAVDLTHTDALGPHATTRPMHFKFIRKRSDRP